MLGYYRSYSICYFYEKQEKLDKEELIYLLKNLDNLLERKLIEKFEINGNILLVEFKS